MLRRLVECLSRDRTKHQVAEVTSLGLVQMTRKKLGLGLVESFSENCEVLRGARHHRPSRPGLQAPPPEPIGSSSGSQNGSTSSRGRRGTRRIGRRSGLAESVKNGVGSTGTHAITEDVRNALAQIAKSTVAAPRARACRARGRRRPSRPTRPAASSRPGRVEHPRDDTPSRSSTSRSRREGLPRRRAAISTQDAEQLLGSVLGALPEPKQPGQGRVARVAPGFERGSGRHSVRERRVAAFASCFFWACVTRSPERCSRLRSSRPVTGSAPSAMSASRRSRGTS